MNNVLQNRIEWIRTARHRYGLDDSLSTMLRRSGTASQPDRIATDVQLDLACIDLMQCHRMLPKDADGGKPRASRLIGYLTDFPTLKQDPNAILDLVDAEVCVFRELGIRVRENEYVRQFPKLESEIRVLVRMEASQSPRIESLERVAEPTRSNTPTIDETGSRAASNSPSNQSLDYSVSGSDGPDVAVAADEDLAAASIPKHLGGYVLKGVVGRGAMGVVYRARQISLDRDVALKIIRPSMAHRPAVVARFTREAYAAAQLNHPGIVPIYDFGVQDGVYHFSMQWMPGGAMDEIVRRRGPLSVRNAVRCGLQIARGLRSAHAAGMVHRDVKPANMLLGENGVVKLADLGLVKIADLMEPIDNDEYTLAPVSGSVSESGNGSFGGSSTGTNDHLSPGTSMRDVVADGTDMTLLGSIVGTPAYMAPEQRRDPTNIDAGADLYSLSASMVFLLTGAPPKIGSSQPSDSATQSSSANASRVADGSDASEPMRLPSSI
ncbi:MAG: serine/threonine-protein kinase, partial [Planctomycetota bacterium]